MSKAMEVPGIQLVYRIKQKPGKDKLHGYDPAQNSAATALYRGHDATENSAPED